MISHLEDVPPRQRSKTRKSLHDVVEGSVAELEDDAMEPVMRPAAYNLRKQAEYRLESRRIPQIEART